MFENITKFIEVITPMVINLIYLLAAIFTLIAFLYGFIKFVEFIARKEINHPDTIKKLSAIIRPSVIFTSKEVVISDQGGMNFIKSITVKLDKGNLLLPSEIVIEFIRFIPVQPILTSLSSFQFYSVASRGKNFSWVFSINPLSSSSEVEDHIFRVEILN